MDSDQSNENLIKVEKKDEGEILNKKLNFNVILI